VSNHEQKAVINMAASRSEIGRVESQNRRLVDEVDRVNRQNSQVDCCVRLDRLRGLLAQCVK